MSRAGWKTAGVSQTFLPTSQKKYLVCARVACALPSKFYLTKQPTFIYILRNNNNITYTFYNFKHLFCIYEQYI